MVASRCLGRTGIAIVVLLLCSPATAGCNLPLRSAYGDAQRDVLAPVIQRFTERFCGPQQERLLRECLKGRHHTAVLYSFDAGGGAPTWATAVFTYAFSSDHLGSDADERRERIGFWVGLDTAVRDGKVRGIQGSPYGPVHAVLDRELSRGKLESEVLRVFEGQLSQTDFVENGVELTVAGVGWRAGGSPGHATVESRHAVDRTKIRSTLEALRALGRYLCDLKGTPRHFRMPNS